MFEIFFSTIWLLITGVITFGFYCSGSNITVNGQYVTQEEFNAMLGPKLFLGIFWVVGITIFIIGIKRIIKNYKTNTYGELCYGRIINIFKSGVYINDEPQLKANIAVYIESIGIVEEIEEVIGVARRVKYREGDYIEGKYYNGDINITDYIPEGAIPIHIQDKLKNLYTPPSDTIVIDGVEYVKKDSINQDY